MRTKVKKAHSGRVRTAATKVRAARRLALFAAAGRSVTRFLNGPAPDRGTESAAESLPLSRTVRERPAWPGAPFRHAGSGQLCRNPLGTGKNGRQAQRSKELQR